MNVARDFQDYLRRYCSPDEMKRVENIVSDPNVTSFLAKEFKVSETEQYLRAETAMFTTSIREEGFPVCKVTVSNSGPRRLKASAAISLDYSKVRVVVLDVAGGQTVTRVLGLGSDIVKDDCIGKDCDCCVSITDSYEREIGSTTGRIRLADHRSDPMLKTDFTFNEISIMNEYFSFDIGSVRIVSSDSFENSVSVSVHDGNERLITRTVHVGPGKTAEVKLMVPLPETKNGDIRHFCVRAEFDGGIIAEEKTDVTLVNEKMRTENRIVPSCLPSGKKLFADCTIQKMVDPWTTDGGDIRFCELIVVNRGVNDEVVQVVFALDGHVFVSLRRPISHGNTEKIILTVPAKAVAKDESSYSEASCHVYDENGQIVMSRSSTVCIRSRFDLDLKNLCRRTAEFVNPLNSAVVSLVDRIDGPIAAAMGEKFSITGYQCPDNVLCQMEATYTAIRDMGMAYVSDTSTLNDENRFQRVRTPEKVLEDHSGNCIELSILFASIFEAMNLEPVIVFPEGHAMVGVVVGTDVYPSSSIPLSCEGERLGFELNTEDGHEFHALLIEATCCADRDSEFKHAVRSAMDTADEQKEFIRKGRYALIKEYRQLGVKPAIW